MASSTTADGLSTYELERLKRIEENERILKELGLSQQKIISSIAPPLPPKEKKLPKKKPPAKLPYTALAGSGGDHNKRVTRSQTGGGAVRGGGGADANKSTSSSLDVQNSSNGDGNNNSYKGRFVDSDDESADAKPHSTPKKEAEEVGNVFGSIPGIEVGHVWETRMECSRDRVHRPPVAGIHGSEQDGCFSIALSGTGQYNDDLDWGDSFTYTGEGGRDLRGTKNNPKNLRTAVQSKDQTLTRGNLAMTRNYYNRKPVRVIRGFKLQSPYAPLEGYRYDGLYTVEKYWETTGVSGYKVFKYALKRVPGQVAPWQTVMTSLVPAAASPLLAPPPHPGEVLPDSGAENAP